VKERGSRGHAPWVASPFGGEGVTLTPASDKKMDLENFSGIKIFTYLCYHTFVPESER
jgi:hypothetical protein